MRRAIALVLLLGALICGWLWWQGQDRTITSDGWSEDIGDI